MSTFAAGLFASRARIFASTRDGLLEKLGSTQLSFEKTSFAGLEARSLTYRMPATSELPLRNGKAIILFVGRRLYVFMAEVTRTLADTRIDRFFSSIELTAAD